MSEKRMQWKRWFLGASIVAATVFQTSCQTTPAPMQEYTLARAALDAARGVQAARHSPGYWHQAEEAYRRARLYYTDRKCLATKLSIATKQDDFLIPELDFSSFANAAGQVLKWGTSE